MTKKRNKEEEKYYEDFKSELRESILVGITNYLENRQSDEQNNDILYEANLGSLGLKYSSEDPHFNKSLEEVFKKDEVIKLPGTEIKISPIDKEVKIEKEDFRFLNTFKIIRD